MGWSRESSLVRLSSQTEKEKDPPLLHITLPVQRRVLIAAGDLSTRSRCSYASDKDAVTEPSKEEMEENQWLASRFASSLQKK